MTSTTPLARAVRTFVASMAGVLATAAVADWVSAFHASAVTLTLGVIAALVAGVIAFLTATGGIQPRTAMGKALATFCQVAVAGLGTVGIANLTTSAAQDFGVAVLRVLIAAVGAGLTTLAVNAS